MPVTEILITGFDGDEPVFAVNLAATTGANESGATANAFEAIRRILDRLPKVSESDAHGSNL